ncbi:MAG: alpha/beta hydrolase [Flavobacteriales bacterium]|nr:alpha/beta hydrolase [Flavobacteriales bacterium]
MTDRIFCLGGLIIDELIFRKLKLPGIEVVHIKYIDHINGETLSDYALRLFNEIKLPIDYTLLGVSFGGMIAIEFSKIRKPKKMFLISTASRLNEVPFRLRLAGRLQLHKLIPRLAVISPFFLFKCLFKVKNEKDIRRIKRLLTPVELKFFEWALESILHWKNKEIPDAIRIHGTNDRILPRKKKVDYPLRGGSHFIMVNKSKEIEKILIENNV